jgi:hypothetical protein
MGQRLEEMNSIPVIWVISKFRGKTENTFFVPRQRMEMILKMIMDGHEDIREPFENLRYFGTFNKENSPF